MSAALTHEPEQLGLLPAVTARTAGPAPAAADQQVACSGLVKHAEVRISSTDGSAHLAVQILQAKDALPFVAVLHNPPRSDDSFLRAMVDRLMQPGAVALLRGHGGLRLRPYRGEPALHLVHCSAIAELSVSEQQQAQAFNTREARHVGA